MRKRPQQKPKITVVPNPPAQSGNAPPPYFDIRMTLDTLNNCLTGLAELPGKVCLPIINDFQAQAMKQAEDYSKKLEAENKGTSPND